MRSRARRHVRTKTRATVLAIALLAGTGLVPAAHGGPPPDTLAGTVYLPNGRTPAPAAAVDLMLADPSGQPVPGSAFARGVTDLAGHFSVDPPERDDLLALARANGGDLLIAEVVGKLAAPGSIDPGPLPGVTTPDTAFAVESTTLHLRPLPDPGGPDPNDVEVFVFDELALGGATRLVLAAADTAARRASVLGMFSDPDLVAGNEDVDDPDVIPPLGVQVQVFNAADPGVMSNPDGTGTPVDDVAPGVPVALNQSTGDGDGGTTSHGCTLAKDQYIPEPGSKQPIEGVDFSVTLTLYKCKDESNPYYDYWGVGVDGWADAHDVSNGSGNPKTYYAIWRFKYRFTTKVTDGSYLWRGVDPTSDTNYGSGTAMTWNVGFQGEIPTAGISGGFTGTEPGKDHQWNDGAKRKLFHNSWLSRHGADLATSSHDRVENGAGITWRVPQGATLHQVMASLQNDILVYRCWFYGNYYNSGCDG